MADICTSCSKLVIACSLAAHSARINLIAAGAFEHAMFRPINDCLCRPDQFRLLNDAAHIGVLIRHLDESSERSGQRLWQLSLLQLKETVLSRIADRV